MFEKSRKVKDVENLAIKAEKNIQADRIEEEEQNFIMVVLTPETIGMGIGIRRPSWFIL